MTSAPKTERKPDIKSLTYEELTERFGKGIMRLWVKERADDGGQAFFEIEDELVSAEELTALANSPEAEPLVAALSRPDDPEP